MSDQLKNYRVIRVNEFAELESSQVTAYDKKEAQEIAVKNNNWERSDTEELFLTVEVVLS